MKDVKGAQCTFHKNDNQFDVWMSEDSSDRWFRNTEKKKKKTGHLKDRVNSLKELKRFKLCSLLNRSRY